jgi:acyl-coenzyme A synthetase/AMP-(fatty) acid ligase
MIRRLLSSAAGIVSGGWAKALPYILAAVATLGAIAAVFGRGYRAGADRVRADVARRDAAAAERARAAQQKTLEAQIQQRPSSPSETAALLRDPRRPF